MADIISIETAVPQYRHQQKDILAFMQTAYGLDDIDKRKLGFVYKQSEIETRYSVIKDFTPSADDRTFIPAGITAAFPNLDERMAIYDTEALPLALEAIHKCLATTIAASDITHLITVSCTGMSAPGLDLQIMEALDLSPSLFRTSVNFMGCYAAIHALKIAKMICDSTTETAHVMIVALELCTLHFQQEYTPDNAASSLLFADGAAAALVSNNISTKKSITLKHFYSQVNLKGKQDMSWTLSSKGFLMKLSSYVPQLIQADIAALVEKALEQNQLTVADITHWCIHPGGKKILEAIQHQMHLCDCSMQYAKKVLAAYGNMSSPTILFVLKEIMEDVHIKEVPSNIFGVAFGPGLTMESFIACKR